MSDRLFIIAPGDVMTPALSDKIIRHADARVRYRLDLGQIIFDLDPAGGVPEQLEGLPRLSPVDVFKETSKPAWTKSR